MLVLIKSGPDTAEGSMGLEMARENGADIVLLQNGVYFARAGALGEWARAVYVLDDDKRLRGLRDTDLDARVRTVGYDVLTDVITGAEGLVGML